jgi:hypothetical protein
MSLRKALNPILRTRYFVASTTSHCFTNTPNIKQNVWYSTEKPVIKSNSNKIDKKKQRDEGNNKSINIDN